MENIFDFLVIWVLSALLYGTISLVSPQKREQWSLDVCLHWNRLWTTEWPASTPGTGYSPNQSQGSQGTSAPLCSAAFSFFQSVSVPTYTLAFSGNSSSATQWESHFFPWPNQLWLGLGTWSRGMCIKHGFYIGHPLYTTSKSSIVAISLAISSRQALLYFRHVKLVPVLLLFPVQGFSETAALVTCRDPATY